MNIIIRKITWPEEKKNPPHNTILIYLETDNWDDFGYVTSFRVYVVDSNGVWEPGHVKILYAKSGDADTCHWTSSKIPVAVSSLSKEKFVSLGQSLDYYKWFNEYPEGTKLLRALADIVVDDAEHSRWTKYKAFSGSLIRFADATKAYEEAYSLLTGRRESLFEFSFTYKLTLPEATGAHEFKFNFNTWEEPLHRVNILIGPNGVGKSTILHKLAEDLSQGKLDRIKFPDDCPRRFSRQILVSTSPFDVSKRPSIGDRSSYRFVGLRWHFESLTSEIRKLSPNKDWKSWLISRFSSRGELLEMLSADFLPNSQHLKALCGKKQDWTAVLDGIVNESLLNQLMDSSTETFNKLSAGQQSIITILTGLSSEMDEESLVLLDEPENHLHPQYLSKFYSALVKLIKQRNSYAIIATHSTLVLQSVPAAAVHILGREVNTPKIRPPAIQCFGASIPSLALDVFNVDAQKAYWVQSLENILNDKANIEDILEMFVPPLEPEVEMYLRSIDKIDS